ncbi:hypothetical protein AXG93_1474s1090 [Marchantia polymorpha subsp. ruderalis]|uniref:Uncharacterized protein n=1 Tax=Marchantia polymorpha subsp. ruderalis TaxID=1480154 RepID=A0A176WBP1_MARPO|nr:hypothetical protein AXG93_1474s1090 [Marchantia polymorpha subsp. ruderalis]
MGKDMETAAQQSTGTGLAVQAGTRTVGGGHRATESHEKEGRKKERKKGRTPLLLFSSDLISFIFVPVASASVRWLCAAGAVRSVSRSERQETGAGNDPLRPVRRGMARDGIMSAPFDTRAALNQREMSPNG